MEELAEEIRDLIENRFEGSRADIEPVSAYKVSGTVLWDGFDEYRQSGRQQMLWDFLRDNLSPQQQMGIATLLTFTPVEVEEMQETLAV